jgi:murein DD-endopeptidase MepM/ murein hydrolase activator NlpD
VAGPHSVAGPGAPLSAIDFAPPPAELSGCHLSLAWVTAAAGGIVARSSGHEVVVDVDGDGFEGSGWTHHYRHLSADQRVAEGTRVKPGQALGHPSCEGSGGTLTRVSFARRYNGEWIPVDQPGAPLVMDGWLVVPGSEPRTGWLTRLGLDPREAAEVKDTGRNGIVALPDEQ